MKFCTMNSTVLEPIHFKYYPVTVSLKLEALNF